MPDPKPEEKPRGPAPTLGKTAWVNPVISQGLPSSFAKGNRVQSGVVTGTVEDVQESRAGNLVVAVRCDSSASDAQGGAIPGRLRRFLFAAWGSMEIE